MSGARVHTAAATGAGADTATGDLPAPALSVVLVSWNGWTLLEPCLTSLVADVPPGVRLDVIVVDNGSTDGTPERLARDWPAVRCLRSRENLGFARANNRALAVARAPLVLLLNNDTTLVPGTLAALLAAADAHPEFALFAPEMRVMAHPDRVDNRGIYLDATGHLRQLDAGRPVAAARPRGEVFAPSGGACLLRRQPVARLGLFEEALESYLEDGEFALRARAAGLRTLYVPDAAVLHVGSATGARIAERKFFLVQRNMRAVARRWLPFRPGRAHSWLGLGYELAQGARALAVGRGPLWLRARRAADAVTFAAPAPTPAARATLREWVGVRHRPLVGAAPPAPGRVPRADGPAYIP